MFKAWTLGLYLFIAGLLCLNPPSNAQLTMMGVGPAGGVAAVIGSAFGDHGTNVTLSTTTIADDTATGVANSFSAVRGTRSYSSGLHYFEIKVLTAPAVANFIIGIMDNTTANGASMDGSTSFANSIGHLEFNGDKQANGWNGINLGSAYSLANNDVMAIALDQANSFYYLALNNVWFLSGDPTSGALGTGAVGNGTFPGARPMLVLWGVPAFSGTHQLKTSTFTYTPPIGYSAWNFLLKRDVVPGASNDNTPMWMEQAA